MSQRSLMRGNRDASQAIESHGVHGFRSNMTVGTENNMAETTAVTAPVKNLNIQNKTNILSEKSDNKVGLGGNILDSLK